MEDKVRRRRIFRKKLKKCDRSQKARDGMSDSDCSQIEDVGTVVKVMDYMRKTVKEHEGQGDDFNSSRINREDVVLKVKKFAIGPTKALKGKYNDANCFQIRQKDIAISKKRINYRDLVAKYTSVKESNKSDNVITMYSKSLTKFTKSENLIYDSNTNCRQSTISLRQFEQIIENSKVTCYSSSRDDRISSRCIEVSSSATKPIIKSELQLRNDLMDTNCACKNPSLTDSSSSYHSLSNVPNEVLIDFRNSKENLKRSFSKQVYDIEDMKNPVKEFRSCLQLDIHTFIKSLNSNYGERLNEFDYLDETACCSFQYKRCHSNKKVKSSNSQQTEMFTGFLNPKQTSEVQLKNYGWMHSNHTLDDGLLIKRNSSYFSPPDTPSKLRLQRSYSHVQLHDIEDFNPLKSVHSSVSLDSHNSNVLLNPNSGERLNEFNSLHDKPCCSNSILKINNIVSSSCSMPPKRLKGKSNLNYHHIKKPFKILRKIDKLKTPSRSKASKEKIASTNAYLAEEVKQHDYIIEINFSQNMIEENVECCPIDGQKDTINLLETRNSLDVETKKTDDVEIMCDSQLVMNNSNQLSDEKSVAAVDKSVHKKNSNVFLQSQYLKSNIDKSNYSSHRFKSNKETHSTKHSKNIMHKHKSGNAPLILDKHQSNNFTNSIGCSNMDRVHQIIKQSHTFAKTENCDNPSKDVKNLKFNTARNARHISLFNSTEESSKSEFDEAHHKKLKQYGTAIIISQNRICKTYGNMCNSALYKSSEELHHMEITELAQTKQSKTFIHNANSSTVFPLYQKHKSNSYKNTFVNSIQSSSHDKRQHAERSNKFVEIKKFVKASMMRKHLQSYSYRNMRSFSHCYSTEDSSPSELEESQESKNLNVFVNMSKNACDTYQNLKYKNYLKVDNSIHLRRIDQPSEEMVQFTQSSIQPDTLISTSKTSQSKSYDDNLVESNFQKSYKAKQPRGVQTPQVSFNCNCRNEKNVEIGRECRQSEQLLLSHVNSSTNLPASNDMTSAMESTDTDSVNKLCFQNNCKDQTVVFGDNVLNTNLHNLVGDCSSFGPLNYAVANNIEYPIRITASNIITKFYTAPYVPTFPSANSDSCVTCDAIADENGGDVDSSITEYHDLSVDENISNGNRGSIDAAYEHFEVVRFSGEMYSRNKTMMFRFPQHFLGGCIYHMPRSNIQRTPP